MATDARAAVESSLRKEWWLRALLVLQSPRAVFAALRDDSAEAASARQEPVLAIVYLAGIAGVLATPVAGRLLDNRQIDGLVVAVWAFLGGGAYGFASYWLGGGLLYLAARPLGSLGSYRRARHVLAYAAAPLALSLLAVWPVKLALYGSDVFRSGGTDSGAGGRVFEGLELAALAWTLVLLAIGVHAVHGWRWGRALAAVGLAAALPVLATLVSNLG